MRRVACAAVFLLACPIALAQHHFHHRPTATAMAAAPSKNSPCKPPMAPAVSQAYFQKVDWTVTTNERAQMFFNQGMTQYYGFNFEEALRNFRGAVDETLGGDRHFAMGWWGIALAAGPNINIAMDKDCREVAENASATAVELTKFWELAPVSGLGREMDELQNDLTRALWLRYNDPEDLGSGAVAYSAAMGRIWDRSRMDGPSRANIGALYAESMLDLRPWGLFNNCQKAALDTDKIERVLKESMAFQARTVGANHFFIHTVEAGDKPCKACDSAALLTTLVPASGHLVHMPSHIFLRVGDYKKSLESNVQAVAVDYCQYDKQPGNPALPGPCFGSYDVYSTNRNCPKLYYGHYQSHNYFFGTASATFLGRSEQAIDLACDTRVHAERFLPNEPELQRYTTAPLLTRVMNRDWCGILDEVPPPKDCSDGCHIFRSMLHWARGMAYTAGATKVGDAPCNVPLQPTPDLDKARQEYREMAHEMTLIVPPTPIGWGNNSAAAVLAIAQSMLMARISWAKGQCMASGKCEVDDRCGANRQCKMGIICGEECPDFTEQAIEHLKLAVTHEDALVYDEPPQWFAPTREALGGAYLQTEQYDKALLTFQAELDRHPESGRALYGKMRALQGQKKKIDAEAAEKTFCDAWRANNADYTMTDQDLWPARTLDAKNVSGATTCSKNPPVPPSSQKKCAPHPPVCPQTFPPKTTEMACTQNQACPK